MITSNAKFPITPENTLRVRNALVNNMQDYQSLASSVDELIRVFYAERTKFLKGEITEAGTSMFNSLVNMNEIPRIDQKSIMDCKFPNTIKPETIEKFCESPDESNINTTKKLYFFAYYMYIRHEFIYESEEYMGKTISDRLATFFRSVNKPILDDHGELIAPPPSIRGEYTIFRPAPYDPLDKVMCSSLKIGSGSIAGRSLKEHECIIEADTDSKPLAIPRSLFGFHTMMGLSAVMFLRNPAQAEARFIFYIHNIDFHDEELPNLKGVVMVDTAHKHPASAWPFVAVANDVLSQEEMRPGFKRLADIGSPSLQRRVRDELARGAVYWNPRDFPNHMRFEAP